MHEARSAPTSSATSLLAKRRSSKKPTRCSMDGTDRKAVVIQERDRVLLRELAVLRVADREQLKLAAGFHSTTRANARLLRLVAAGLLRRYFLGTRVGARKALYALSPKGAALVQVSTHGLRRRKDEPLTTDFYIEHQLAVND